MTQTIILHNPRCSKSRQTLQILEQQGCDFEIREYLKQPLSKTELSELMSQLGLSDVRQMMRTKETEYKQQNLGDDGLSDDALLTAIVDTPKLLERPVVINNGQARIGRPPESVLEIL